MPQQVSLKIKSKKRNIVPYLALPIAIMVVVCSTFAFVSAHQSPGGCNSNRFNVSIIRDKTQVQQGDTLTYTITASNLDGPGNVACDITDADITVRLPAADGTPTGTLVTVATDVNFPNNTAITMIGTVPYVVNVNPGVVDIVAEVRGEGVLHDAPVDHSALIVRTLGTTVVEEENPEPPSPNPETPRNNPPGSLTNPLYPFVK